MIHGVPCTAADRAIFDASRWAPNVREAVVVIDMAVAARLASLHQVRRYAETKAGWAGVQQVRDALGLATERSRSPAESRLRLLWTLDAGLPQPLVNWPVADSRGRFLAEVDLLDPAAGLVGEYDGADHRSGARHARDVRREDALRRVGLELVTVTGRDLASPGMVKDRILSARERAARIPPASKTFLIKVAPKPVR
ncbi:hypothetical protein EFK50_07500 [Nocardioides marmoriginsengisoli]|uniref:DUF559 domain-containing protein n=1 Tax=Nocardioides marmoriginsengisoli TaxID=661483 RepID=A0A3N0CN75_9ACTN|nr:hypothetical protein EFK50_07500 [Nocardioides marmoriginsengisoli]